MKAPTKALIKIGGSLLDDPASRQDIAQQIADVAASGVSVTVVHGGGKQMTRFLAERGIQSQFVGGLRVTTDETIDALLKVLAGTVNTQLVGALCAAGARAVGLTGIDAGLATAVRNTIRNSGLWAAWWRRIQLFWMLCPMRACCPWSPAVAGGENGQEFST